MAATVQELINILQQIAPDSLAEEWDNVGLLVGNPGQSVTKILLALDPSPTLIEQAVVNSCELVITHHPAIFRPLKSLRTDTPTGKFLALALQHNIAIIGCHTNLDATSGGVSDVLAAKLGLENLVPLLPSKNGCTEQGACGLGRIGTYPTPRSTTSFIHTLQQATQAPWLLEAGPRPESIAKVAVCGGSCGDFAELAQSRGVDVFVTAEIKHNVARWAEDAHFWLIDGGHFATENPAMELLKQHLQKALNDAEIKAVIMVAKQTSPLRLIQEHQPPTV